MFKNRTMESVNCKLLVKLLVKVKTVRGFIDEKETKKENSSFRFSAWNCIGKYLQ
jgi:hypothetical protein